MPNLRLPALAASLLLASACAATPDPAPAPAAVEPAPQGPLAFLQGEWRGEASVPDRDGGWMKLTQTERVGTMLDGAVTVIEGRGYDEAGVVRFNAFAVVSHDARRDVWEMRSYAGDSAGTFPFEAKPSGFVWSTPAGPDAITRYTATITGDRWDQIGEYVPKTGEPRKVFEMHLTRLGDTGWPSAGAVQPK
jgi:hypothetical protein